MQTKDLADGGYAAAQAMAAGALRQGYDVIADCVNPIALTRTAWRNVSREAHARHIDVELICSDRREHRCRVETRKVDLAGWQPPEWSAVMTREYERMPEAALCIDTSRTTVEQSVARLTAAIRNPEGD